MSVLEFRHATLQGNLHHMKCLRSIQSEWDHTIFWFAAATGDIEILDWLFKEGCPLTKITFNYAKSVETLQWLISKNIEWDTHTFSNAVKTGNIQILEFLLEKKCPWSKETLTIAARHGDIDVVKWLCDNKCPYDHNTFSNSVIYGSMETIEYLLQYGCPFDIYTFEYAVLREDIDILTLLLKENCPISYGSIDTARRLKTNKILHWIIKNRIIEYEIVN